MTEKDLDIAIEKCERIMEMDARTMQNPVSENGWIFEKVYELLQYLRQFQFATDTNVATTDTISRQAALDVLHGYFDGMLETDTVCPKDLYNEIEALPSAQPGYVDAVPRTSVEYICRKNTVSTNPYEHKYHDKFIQFMDDQEISDFGRWQHSNGFNTALVAVQCDLDKVPSVTPKQPGWIPCSTALPELDGTYLVTKRSFGWNCKEYIEIDIARYEKKNGWHKADEVLAWCELPKPYREGGQDGAD